MEHAAHPAFPSAFLTPFTTSRKSLLSFPFSILIKKGVASSLLPSVGNNMILVLPYWSQCLYLWYWFLIYDSVLSFLCKYVYCVKNWFFFFLMRMLFFLIFWLCRIACGILVPWPGIKPEQPAPAARAPNTGLPEKSQELNWQRKILRTLGFTGLLVCGKNY